MAETENNEMFFKQKTKVINLYLKEKKKQDFQTICSRLGTSCNKQLNNFVDLFINQNQKVLDAARVQKNLP